MHTNAQETVREALAQFLAGSDHAACGDWPAAEAGMASALLLDPALHIARYQLGLVQFTSGRTALAQLTWQPLLHRRDESWMGDFARGFAALARDQLANASEHFHAGLRHAGVNPFVAADIRKVLEDLQALAGDAHGAPGSPPADGVAAHVLVANYGRLSLH